jgi:hypothetical protein
VRGTYSSFMLGTTVPLLPSYSSNNGIGFVLHGRINDMNMPMADDAKSFPETME